MSILKQKGFAVDGWQLFNAPAVFRHDAGFATFDRNHSLRGIREYWSQQACKQQRPYRRRIVSSGNASREQSFPRAKERMRHTARVLPLRTQFRVAIPSTLNKIAPDAAPKTEM